ncbi:cytochrome c [Marivirga salinae]|uniref:Cytochrome c n=1 Tax=Marivirga salinarum TaxID=3059078 RepID=A0AA49J917_9BACT|nr:cytochrome c [Marivirga sp. BDSF4-3]WKK73617.2 cytochrome c [Marivirga sp. BDSF4-3]
MNKKSNIILIISSLLIFIYGCEYERIAQPEIECESFELVVESVQNTACATSSGEIVASVNGTDQYLYRLNDGDFAENNVFTELGAGNYTVQAIDQNTQCVSEPIEVSIENEDGIQISLIEKSESECGDNTGTILISQEDGVEPIEYLINGAEPQGTPEFTGLSSGEYTILARDANGCEAELSGIEISTNISFSDDVKPIIATNCAVNGCHNGTQSPNFTIDENIIQNASRIKNRTGSGTMPPAGRPDLTEEEIQAIACWVDGGALEN